MGLAINDTRVEVAYFRGNAKFGRTTKLVSKASGVVLAEGMGVCTRKQMWKLFQDQNAEAVRGNQAVSSDRN